MKNRSIVLLTVFMALYGFIVMTGAEILSASGVTPGMNSDSGYFLTTDPGQKVPLAENPRSPFFKNLDYTGKKSFTRKTAIQPVYSQ